MSRYILRTPTEYIPKKKNNHKRTTHTNTLTHILEYITLHTHTHSTHVTYLSPLVSSVNATICWINQNPRYGCPNAPREKPPERDKYSTPRHPAQYHASVCTASIPPSWVSFGMWYLKREERSRRKIRKRRRGGEEEITRLC